MKTRNATRTSNGLPRKRPSYDLEALRPSRSKKQTRPSRSKKQTRSSRSKMQTQPSPKKKSPFMELPAEIRLEILRELLWAPEPLKLLREASEPANILPTLFSTVGLPSWDDGVTGTNYTLYPEILAVCRKLNEENTVDVVASFNLGYPYGPRFEWMGHLSSLTSISESFNARARKLRITVDARIPPFHTSKAIREVVRALVKVLQANPQWCSLDIRLENHISCSMQDEFSSGEEILRPLNLLRRLQHIELTGVSPQFATELSKLAKSDRPILDLPKMYDNLVGYGYRYIGGTQIFQ